MINDVFDTLLITLEFPITNNTQNYLKVLFFGFPRIDY
jgi:hypothetical protein